MQVEVSIVITNYNKSFFLEEAVKSALSQTIKCEIILIDDASTDNSIEIINKIRRANKNLIFIQNNKNMGVVYSRNKAIEQSNGKYILPLDADDIIEPTYAEKAKKYLDKNDKCGIVYCNARRFGKINDNWNLINYDKNVIWYKNHIFSTAMFRKKDWSSIGGYDNKFNSGHEDWDFWLSILERGRTPFKINEYLFKYRILETSRSTSADKRVNLEFETIFKKHINWILSIDGSIQKIFKALVQYDNGSAIIYKRKYKRYKNLLLLSVLINFVLTIEYLSKLI